MAKLSALLFLLLSSWYCFGQNPPSLDLYTSGDNSFSFAYPDTYDLLAGDGILKRTQGKRSGIPLCDLLTAFACVLYPSDSLEGSRIEAAAFSVNSIVAGASEHDCVGYADQLPRPHGESVLLNGQLFRYAVTTTALAGHSQSVQRYRSFHKGQCYELRVAITLADAVPSPSPAKNVIDSKDAGRALHSLERVLSSFVFAD